VLRSNAGPAVPTKSSRLIGATHHRRLCMGSRWLAFAGALAAAFALLPATGGEARKKTCKVRGSHTHLQTRSLRVFSIFRGSNTGAGSSKYFACYRKNGRKTKIGVQTGPKQIYTYKPAGRFLPYMNSSPDRWTVRLLDAKSGKLKFDFVILDKDGTVGGALATPSGGFAFTLYEEAIEEGRRLSLYGHKAGTGKHAYTKLSAETVKDVKRKGDVVSWTTDSGNRGSADLGR
jgi:hypothetical protein